MWSKFSSFRLKTSPDQDSLNPFAKLNKLLVFADTYPDNPWLTPWREKTNPFKAQGERLTLYVHKCLLDNLENHCINFADEPDREVEVFRLHPPGSREAAAQKGKPLLNL